MQACVALLHHKAIPLAAQVYAAQTLRQKVRRQLATLSCEDVVTLQRSLVGCLAAITNKPLSVSSQLCLAVASLILQMPPMTDPLQKLGKPMVRWVVFQRVKVAELALS